MGIGLRIRELREANNLSQYEFGQSIQCGRSTIAQIERGKQFPTLQMLSDIVRIYDINYNYLIDGSVIYDKDTNQNFAEEEPSLMLSKIIELSKELAFLQRDYDDLKKRHSILLASYNVTDINLKVAEETANYGNKK